MRRESRDENANKYIAPDPRPHIDHEKEQEQRLLWSKALRMIENGDLDGVLELMEAKGFTSEQRERARELFQEFHGTSQVIQRSGQSGGRRR
jgi:hypothetical protein